MTSVADTPAFLALTTRLATTLTTPCVATRPPVKERSIVYPLLARAVRDVLLHAPRTSPRIVTCVTEVAPTAEDFKIVGRTYGDSELLPSGGLRLAEKVMQSAWRGERVTAVGVPEAMSVLKRGRGGIALLRVKEMVTEQHVASILNEVSRIRYAPGQDPGTLVLVCDSSVRHAGGGFSLAKPAYSDLAERLLYKHVFGPMLRRLMQASDVSVLLTASDADPAAFIERHNYFRVWNVAAS